MADKVSGPSLVHAAQAEKDAPEDWPHSVPVVIERISNSYFSHMVDGDWTERHGVLYSVEGRPFKGLGDAIIWCLQNPKPAEVASPLPVSGGGATSPPSVINDGAGEAPAAGDAPKPQIT